MGDSLGLVRSRSSVDDLLAAARQRLQRCTPLQAWDAYQSGALLVDIRPVAHRRIEGEIPGSLILERNVLEWRLDPSCAHHITQITDPGQRIVVVCNEGYSSSLAAATLRDLGLSRATDLAGGFQAWRAIVTVRESAQPRT